MSRLTFVVFLTVVTIYFALLDGADVQKTCKAVIADLMKRQMSGLSKCTKSLKFKNGKEKAAKSMCILKCAMINEGLMDDNGGFSEKIAIDFIKNTFAEVDHERVIKEFKICSDEFGALIDPTEEYCKTYEPVIKCVTAKMPTICS